VTAEQTQISRPAVGLGDVESLVGEVKALERKARQGKKTTEQMELDAE
jgi:hypothetical protein